MKILPVPCLSDNYAYVLVDETANVAAVIDPVESTKVLAAARETGMELAAVLTTHHHADHSGGNDGVAAAVPGIAVYGGDERIPAVTTKVKDGDKFALGSLDVRAIKTCGHTSGSICYYVEDRANDQRAVFTGDTLFVGGCGRLFEGSPADMHDSLNVKLAALPDDTLVFAGHEYTSANLRFALSVDADNQALQTKAQRCAEARCTMPSTIAEEKDTNPFMRVTQPALQRAANATDPVEALRVIRQMKDRF
ncbi:Cytoplasmic glyoxalase II [Coemansia nantahalensis]|nr:Cytoplasmic glyoxalase II [Coemansia nantahalensis]